MKVWTFHIQGGDPFEITLPQNPKCEHTGGRTLWKLCGSEKLRNVAETLIRQQGAEVQVYAEIENAEQKVLRAGKHLAIAAQADDFDYTQIDESIRHTVRVLRQAGFDTCASGEGSDLEGDGCVLESPHVVMTVKPPRNLIPETHRLKELMESHGVVFEPRGPELLSIPYLRGSYDPVTDSGTITLFNTSLEL